MGNRLCIFVTLIQIFCELQLMCISFNKLKKRYAFKRCMSWQQQIQHDTGTFIFILPTYFHTNINPALYLSLGSKQLRDGRKINKSFHVL